MSTTNGATSYHQQENYRVFSSLAPELQPQGLLKSTSVRGIQVPIQFRKGACMHKPHRHTAQPLIVRPFHLDFYTSPSSHCLKISKSKAMSTFTLEDAVRQLQDDHDNGASILATAALESLKKLTQTVENPYIAQHLWENLCLFGWELKNARPSMDAAIGGALITALSSVKAKWDTEFGSGWPSGGCRGSRMKDAAVVAIEEAIQARKKTLKLLTEEFAEWMNYQNQDMGNRPIKILTLSYSSSMKACLSAALRDIPNFEVELRILESRPRFEGAFLALALLKDLGKEEAHRLKVQVESDSSVAMLAKDVDFVLLGADRISRSGCVSNKIGSLVACLCVKEFSPGAKVVVLSENDKIVVDESLEGHAEEENDKAEIRAAWGEKWENLEKELGLNSGEGVVTRNVYFETVEGRHVDLYICEKGVLEREDVTRISVERGVKEAEIFGSFKREPETDA